MGVVMSVLGAKPFRFGLFVSRPSSVLRLCLALLALSLPLRFSDVQAQLYTGSVTAGSAGVRPEEKEGKWSASEAWKNKELTCYFSTPVVVGEHVYVVTGTANIRAPSSTLHCVEAKTGKVLWKKEKVGRFHAALLRTGDSKLLMLDDFGNLTLIDPDPKEYRELSRSKVCGPTWAHPALADGLVYFRDEKQLYCVQLGE